MSKASKVTVCSISYNHEKWLPEYFKGLEDQSAPPAEVVIVDDASTDTSSDIFRKYLGLSGDDGGSPHLTIRLPDTNFSYIRHSENLGSVRTLEHAVTEALSKGTEFIAFCETDDFFLRPKLEVQSKFLDEHRYFGAVCSEVTTHWEDGRKMERSWAEIGIHPAEDLTYEILSGGNRIYTCSLMVRADVLSDCPPPSHWEALGYDFLIDYPMYLWIAHFTGAIKFLRDPLSVYRIHSGSISKQSEGNQQRMQIADHKVRRDATTGQLFQPCSLPCKNCRKSEGH